MTLVFGPEAFFVSSFRESARIFVVFFPFLLFGDLVFGIVPGCIPRTISPFRRFGIQRRQKVGWVSPNLLFGDLVLYQFVEVIGRPEATTDKEASNHGFSYFKALFLRLNISVWRDQNLPSRLERVGCYS